MLLSREIGSLIHKSMSPAFVRFIVFLLPVILIVPSGCRSSRVPTVRFEQLNTFDLLPREATSVEIFITTTPQKPYSELGVVSLLTYKYNPSDRTNYFRLREKAADVGADAIIVIESRGETYTNYVTKQTYTGKVYRAMAIHYQNKQ
jgi:hypothetical protein